MSSDLQPPPRIPVPVIRPRTESQLWTLGMRTRVNTEKMTGQNTEYFLYHKETGQEISLDHLLLGATFLTPVNQPPTLQAVFVTPISFANKAPSDIVRPGGPN